MAGERGEEKGTKEPDQEGALAEVVDMKVDQLDLDHDGPLPWIQR